MILVVVDDLLFRSKISTTAKATGVQTKVATTAEAALECIKNDQPSLVLFDLDSTRTRPFDVLRELAGDPALRDVPTLGFVSHVHADLVQQARALGIGTVMARSAFAASLPEILLRHASSSPKP